MNQPLFNKWQTKFTRKIAHYPNQICPNEASANVAENWYKHLNRANIKRIRNNISVRLEFRQRKRNDLVTSFESILLEMLG